MAGGNTIQLYDLDSRQSYVV